MNTPATRLRSSATVSSFPHYAAIAEFASFANTALIPGENVIVAGPTACPADINHDGIVGFADLQIVLATWGPCSGPCPSDVNDDGTVDFNDMLLVLADWS